MYFRKWKLRTHLMLFSLLLAVGLLIAFGLFSYQAAGHMITGEITDNALATLEQLNRLSSEWTSTFEFLSLSMVMDSQLEQALRDLRQLELLDQVDAVNRINERTVFYRSFRDDIQQITIYTDFADLSPYYMDWGYQGLKRLDTNSYRAISGYLTESNTGVLPLHETRADRDVRGAADSQVISYYRRIKVFSDDEELGLICIDIRSEAITQLLSTQFSGNDLYFMVNTLQQPVAFGRNRQEEAAGFLAGNEAVLAELPPEQGLRMIDYNGGRYLLFFSSYNRFGQRTIHLRPYGDVTGALGGLLWKIILFGAGCLALAGCWVLVFSRSFVRPIGALVSRMEQVGGGDFNIAPVEGYSNEIGKLSGRFVWMTNEIQGLIHRLEQVSAQKTQAEFETLQQQINPHFLYNTLDCINWMAIQSRADNISEAISLLGQFFRASLSHGAVAIPLRLELERLRIYIDLQNMRLEHHISYREELPGEVLDYQIVRLVLQPFVENSVIHGFQGRWEGAEITVSGWREADGLYLQISDNGRGVDADRMNRYMRGLEPRKQGYGVYNVNQRIRLYYGEEFGAAYLSVVKGATVVIHLPDQGIATPTEDGYVPDDHC